MKGIEEVGIDPMHVKRIELAPRSVAETKQKKRHKKLYVSCAHGSKLSWPGALLPRKAFSTRSPTEGSEEYAIVAVDERLAICSEADIGVHG